MRKKIRIIVVAGVIAAVGGIAIAARDAKDEGKAAAPIVPESKDEFVELANVSDEPVDIGGYYKPDMGKLAKAMRPSATLNAALAGLTR